MRNRLRSWTVSILAVVLLGLLWHHVFVMTGVLWWNAPSLESPVPRPAAVHINPPPTDWVDVEAYLRTHPVWQP